MSKRFAKVVAGVIEHICMAEKPEDAPGYLEMDDAADAEIGIGDLHDGSKFGKRPPPPKSAEELAKEAQQSADAVERAGAKNVAALKYLANHTNAEIRAFLQGDIAVASVTDLASAKACLNRMENRIEDLAVGLAVFVRRELR